MPNPPSIVANPVEDMMVVLEGGDEARETDEVELVVPAGCRGGNVPAPITETARMAAATITTAAILPVLPIAMSFHSQLLCKVNRIQEKVGRTIDWVITRGYLYVSRAIG